MALTEVFKGQETKKKKALVTTEELRPTWTDEGCIAGSVLDGGVSAVKLTQLS